MFKRGKQLTLVPAKYNPSEVLWAVEGSLPVGVVIPSDVYPGRYRAGVYTAQTAWYGDVPVSGTKWICVTASGETLVDKPQAGTENFASTQEALKSIARNRRL